MLQLILWNGLNFSSKVELKKIWTKKIFAGSFKSQLIGYFSRYIVFWELVEGSLWQFYDNKT